MAKEVKVFLENNSTQEKGKQYIYVKKKYYDINIHMVW